VRGLAYHPVMTTQRTLDPDDLIDPAAPEGRGPGQDSELPGEPAAAQAPAEPDPGAEVAGVLDAADAAEQLAGLDRATLTALTTTTTGAARDAADAEWLRRLGTLRRGLLLRGERPLLALVLGVQARLSLSLDQPEVAVDAADTLWGVRELLGQPWKAHAAMLLLAEAQAESDDVGAAEMTLLKAMEAARKLAPAGNLVPASAAVARTLTQLGTLLWAQGRGVEAVEWLEGAVDVAPDDETRAAAEAVLQRFGG
jgi:hypothetical protein